MDQKELTKRHFNRFIRFYDQITGKWFYRNQLDLIRRMELRVNSIILDVGCGTGKAVAELARKMPDGRIYGIDLSERMVEKAIQRTEQWAHVQVLPGDAENIPFESDFFSDCFSTLSFHHFVNPRRALQEIARVLKQGGRLYMIDHFQDTLFGQLMEVVVCQHFSPGHVKAYTPQELSRMLETCGFQKVVFEHYRWHLGLIIAEKG